MDDLAAKDAKNKKKLQALMNAKGSGNDRCADCRAPYALWASVTLGVFLCEKCSHVHRKYLDAELSRIRSCETDTWTEPRLARMKAVGGNSKFNASWEAKFKSSGRKRPDDSFTVFQRSQFITDKYMKKVFFAEQLPSEGSREESDSETEKSPKPKSKQKKQLPSVTDQLEAWTLAPPPAGTRTASEPLPKSKTTAPLFLFDDEPLKTVVHVAASSGVDEDDFWGEPISASRSHSLPAAVKAPAASVDFFFDDEPTRTEKQPGVASEPKASQSSLDLLFASPPAAFAPSFLDVFSGTSSTDVPLNPPNTKPVSTTAFGLKGTGLLMGSGGGMMGGCIVEPPVCPMYGGLASYSGMGVPSPSKSPKPNIMDLFGPTPSPAR